MLKHIGTKAFKNTIEKLYALFLTLLLRVLNVLFTTKAKEGVIERVVFF